MILNILLAAALATSITALIWTVEVLWLGMKAGKK